MANILCELPLRFDSGIMIVADVISLVGGLAMGPNKKLGPLGVPSWTWTVSGGIGLLLAGLSIMSCPPIPNVPQRKICVDKYGRSYFC
jgi:hypothetical protein